jgi:hypothetical protein
MRRATDPEYREKANARSRQWQQEKRSSDPQWREKEKARVREAVRRTERRGRAAIKMLRIWVISVELTKALKEKKYGQTDS